MQKITLMLRVHLILGFHVGLLLQVLKILDELKKK